MSTHLRDARNRKGLTQVQVAEILGKTQADISKYENGTRPSDLEFIGRYAELIGLTREEVIFGVETAKAA